MLPTSRTGAIQQIETDRGVNLLKGEPLVLAASAARTATAGTNGTAIPLNGERMILAIELRFTNKTHEAGDTCDVYIDFLGPDGVNWINAVHFAQEHGDHADASAHYVLLIPNAGSTKTVDVTSDALADVVRPEVTGSQIRARWVIVDSGDADASFTFAINAYAL